MYLSGPSANMELGCLCVRGGGLLGIIKMSCLKLVPISSREHIQGSELWDLTLFMDRST